MEQFIGAVWQKLSILHYSVLQSGIKFSCRDVEFKLFKTFNAEILWLDFLFAPAVTAFIYSLCLLFFRT